MSLNPVYINFASKMELQKLKGVGPAVADNIKAYLSESGIFLGPEDLAQVRNLKLNKEEIERISFHTNPKYSFLHTTKSQSEGSTSVGDVSENSPSPAVHETADEEVFTDQGIGPGDTPHGNPQSERTGSEEIMNDALRGLITKKNKEKSKSQSLRPKEFELPPLLKDPSDQSYVTGARSVNNEQKPVVGAGIDTFEQKHAVIAGMEGGYLNTQMLNTSVAPPIQTSCSPVPANNRKCTIRWNAATMGYAIFPGLINNDAALRYGAVGTLPISILPSTTIWASHNVITAD